MWIKSFAAEFFPVTLFLIGNVFWNFFVGVTLMVSSAVIAFFFLLYTEKRIPFFALVSTVFVTCFGVSTLYFQNEEIFKINDSAMDGFYAVVLLISIFLNRPLLKPLFSSIFAMSDDGWRILTIRWATFFLLLVAANEFVRRTFSTEVWVYYKTTMFFVVFAFGLYQFRLSARERIPEESNKYGLRIAPEMVLSNVEDEDINK